MAATLRLRRPGDMGWLLERHGTVYPEEFGYLPVFEDYVARTIPPYLEHFDPALDASWVAELDGRRVGSVTIQHDPERRPRPDLKVWAKLRWFLVEREARGQGVGSQLLAAALAFARERYDGVWLLTVSDLAAARRHYEKAGFRLVREAMEPCPWAPWAHEQEWELDFRTRPGAP